MPINPFKPNSPVSPGMFAGRLDEVEKLDAALLQTKAGNPCNFMITGERGIGKSSLLNYINSVARGHIDLETDKVNFLVIDTDIDQSTTQIGLVKKIELGLRRELDDTESARAFLSKTWGFISRIEAAGVKLQSESKVVDEETLLDEFAFSLSDTVERVCNSSTAASKFSAHYDGLLILIDEADNSSKSLSLGSLLKLLVERLQRRGCERVMFGLAGLPSLRDVLLASHASSVRLFEEHILGRLGDSEVAWVIDRCMAKATRDNSADYQITASGRKALVALSEGFPHFIQQFGFSAFAADTDKSLDINDVMSGAFDPRGALDQIGDRYYRDDFYNKIQRESYRQVLRIMADRQDSWITKIDIRRKFKGTTSTLNNAIKALRDRHIIVSKEGERGVYRLQHRGFAMWIKLRSAGDEGRPSLEELGLSDLVD